MTDQQAQDILNKTVEQIFGYQNPYTLEQFKQKYAFDLKLPVEVFDSTTGESTWAISANPTKFITMKNASAEAQGKDFLIPKRELNNIEDIIAAWQETNLTTTERTIESINVAKSDNIYGSDSVYNSQDIINSKNVLFSGSVQNSECVTCSQRSNTLAYCIRAEDSKACSNSFNVIWSNKIADSFFIQDCFDLTDCMFCSHIASKQYCIANMQFTKEEYFKLKDIVVRWILSD
jgi:hypothetical protein